MTDHELSELLAHPRVRAFVERVAREAAAQAYAELSVNHKAKSVPRATPAAAGDLNYADAAVLIGCPRESVRSYVCSGKMERGKLPRTVTYTSCMTFKQTYKPRPSGRSSGNH